MTNAVTHSVTATSGPAPIVEVGPLRLWSPVILAPMAGVTDAPFRRLCRLYGEESLPDSLHPDRGAIHPKTGGAAVRGIDGPAGLYVAEMVTSRALVEGRERTRDMVRPDPTERIRSIQLYGVNPPVMAAAASILVEEDFADHIDINFGCPVPKVTKKGGGAALPWKKDLYTDLVASVVRAAEASGKKVGRDVPVTVKMRIGIDDEHVTYLDAAKIAQDQGALGVCLHARTQTQHYAGKARWEAIARLKEHVSIPVFGNGDVFEGADALRMMEETGCDAVEIGRGCQGRPWLFRDIVAAAHGLDAPAQPDLREIASIIMRHAQWVVEDQGNELRGMREMRKHVGWYMRGFAVGGPQRQALNMVSSLEELEQRLNDLDLDQPFPKAAQGARGRAGGEKTPHLPDGWLDSPCLTEDERATLHLAELGVSGG